MRAQLTEQSERKLQARIYPALWAERFNKKPLPKGRGSIRAYHLRRTKRSVNDALIEGET